MAYCRNCGAYLPDGQTVCMACGADSTVSYQASATQSASQAQTSSAPSSDDLRHQLEEKQRKQQEQSKEWAKQAYEEYKASSTHTTSSSTGGKPNSEVKSGEKSKKTLGKVLAVLSYVSAGCILPFIITPDDEFAKFHGKQGVLLLALSIIIDILGGLKSIAFILSVGRLYLMYVGIKNVLCNRMEKLPFIGKYADKF
ncbi:MAG: zinc ribbon domain-containing protein [Eubacteriales bacterium]|nr:zinc ribbon domain-containing protein [Eubacteriales bacterium]